MGDTFIETYDELSSGDMDERTKVLRSGLESYVSDGFMGMGGVFGEKLTQSQADAIMRAAKKALARLSEIGFTESIASDWCTDVGAALTFELKAKPTAGALHAINSAFAAERELKGLRRFEPIEGDWAISLLFERHPGLGLSFDEYEDMLNGKLRKVIYVIADDLDRLYYAGVSKKAALSEWEEAKYAWENWKDYKVPMSYDCPLHLLAFRCDGDGECLERLSDGSQYSAFLYHARTTEWFGKSIEDMTDLDVAHGVYERYEDDEDDEDDD